MLFLNLLKENMYYYKNAHHFINPSLYVLKANA